MPPSHSLDTTAKEIAFTFKRYAMAPKRTYDQKSLLDHAHDPVPRRRTPVIDQRKLYEKRPSQVTMPKCNFRRVLQYAVDLE